ncbi:MAG: sigma-70 family RNA polymerase sigma factor [Sphingomonadaceae bacterium]|nr:sigma-70 family RNA polymerase sigma factor [Sphingomonadaceae bacterium]
MTRTTARLLDEYLVASAQAGGRSGGRAAVEQLAKRWHPKLVGHAMRLTGERELAEDAVQAAWGEIVKGIARLQDPRAFPAWAFRIVSRACAKEIDRATRRRRLAHAYAAEPRETSSEPVEPDDAARLRQAIRQLPPGERAAIALHHFEDLRVAEVAVALDVPVGTVKSRLANARTRLRAILEGENP